MSDSFEMLVDTEVTLAQANGVAKVVLAKFRELGLITGKLTAQCVLGGQGYCPGPAVADLYKAGKRELRFWELTTCGVEPSVGRSFNESALGPACEGFDCPSCSAEIDPFDEDFSDRVFQAIENWTNDSGSTLVTCPECRQKCAITKWQCRPPLAFGNLSFRFWNWPPFTARGWKIDIRAVVQQATQHVIVATNGHI